jgi:release factor glutamine methyltransferase
VADAPRPLTVEALRDALAARLSGHVDDPLDEARELLAGLHDAPRSWASVHADDELLDLLRDVAEDAAEKRIAGAPLQYATNRSAFRHLYLHVDERVLIPRPETEELVSLALPLIAVGATVVDVGTGSGAIALSIAKESQAARVVGTDLSSDAIDVAEMNARAVLHREYARTEFVVGNLLDAVTDEHIDVIVSNPPYIATYERAELPSGVREWEPELALFGGPDGMQVIRALVAQSAQRLAVGGMLLLEIDARRGPATLALLTEPYWRDVQLVADSFGRDRFVVGRRTAAPVLAVAPGAAGRAATG